MYLLVQLWWWSLSVLLRVDAVRWLFLLVRFRFRALWISERSFVLFLKLSLFLAGFVSYNCGLWFRRTHGLLKCRLWNKKRWKLWLCWLKWSKFPEIVSSPLALTQEIDKPEKWHFHGKFLILQKRVTTRHRGTCSICKVTGLETGHPRWRAPWLPESLVVFVIEEPLPPSGSVPGAVTS